MEWSTRSYAAWAAMALVVATLVGILILISTFSNAPVASARSTDHGASFAVRCDFSHRAQDDPIVHRNMPGMAHSHDFFGNVTTDADSTYESLRSPEAATTCTRPEDTAAYWLPTVYWDGEPLDSNRAVFYYRAGGKNYKNVKPFPADLKVIARNPKYVFWRCGRTDNGGGNPNPPKQCDNGELGVRIIFPDCWDGKHTDNAVDHSSHMAYSRPVDGKVRCPRSRPVPVPSLTMNATFPIPNTPGEVTLACNEDSPCGPSTMHADFFNAWDQEAPLNLNPPDGRSFGGLNALVKHCINQVPPSKPRPEECQSPRP
jgi:hypothetical protein